ncbi:MAG: acetylglutamate kinase [Spirochaetia bacterium]|jgi:acetylglutamate kinase|nr:acetylglutamate kinase [Spirochaetia bacterium]
MTTDKESGKKIIVIKSGGKAASGKKEMASLFREMRQLEDKYSFVFVHGGGAEVTRVSKIFGLEAKFKDGIRLTTPDEMEIVDMVLSGRMNKEIVRLANSCGVVSVGLSGSDSLLFTGKEAGENTLTGKITEVKPDIIKILLENSFMPVISSTSMTMSGTALNINADEAALEIASALKAEKLFFISDIPGVMKEGEVIPLLTEESAIEEISAGVISGGMIPKVKSSIEALKKGVKTIIIGDYFENGDLSSILEGIKGTGIIL